MRIGQIAPLFEAVPPKFYGGTERVIHYLTEELVEMGHEVTLFASFHPWLINPFLLSCCLLTSSLVCWCGVHYVTGMFPGYYRCTFKNNFV